jgi:hypothetical protein
MVVMQILHLLSAMQAGNTYRLGYMARTALKQLKGSTALFGLSAFSPLDLRHE